MIDEQVDALMGFPKYVLTVVDDMVQYPLVYIITDDPKPGILMQLY